MKGTYTGNSPKKKKKKKIKIQSDNNPLLEGHQHAF